jgi:hypothetical protein
MCGRETILFHSIEVVIVIGAVRNCLVNIEAVPPAESLAKRDASSRCGLKGMTPLTTPQVIKKVSKGFP